MNALGARVARLVRAIGGGPALFRLTLGAHAVVGGVFAREPLGLALVSTVAACAWVADARHWTKTSSWMLVFLAIVAGNGLTAALLDGTPYAYDLRVHTVVGSVYTALTAGLPLVLAHFDMERLLAPLPVPPNG